MLDEAPAAPGAAGETPAAAPPPEREVERLRAELETRAREAAEAQDRALRALADFDNYRKRTLREREDWSRQAQEQVLREILPVLDNFDRALAAPAGPGSDGGFRAGVELIHREFLKTLERLGVRPFETVGQRFDPLRHEAVARLERGDVEEATVVGEALRGYLIQDRVLRPAQVAVAVPAPPGAGTAPAEGPG
jgi:molecular chaperone GrpE